MNIDDRDDAIVRRLSRLPRPAPDAARAERIVAQCQAALVRRHRRRVQRRGWARRTSEPAVIAGLSLAYLIAIVLNLWRWRGMF